MAESARELPRNGSITRGIIYLLLGLLVLYTVHVVFFTRALGDMARLVRTIHNHPLVVSNAAQQANTKIIKIQAEINDIVLFRESEAVAERLAWVQQLEAQTHDQLQLVRDNILGDKGEQLADYAAKLFAAWGEVRQRIIDRVNAGQWQEAAEITRAAGAAQVARLEAAMVELNAYARRKGTEFVGEMERTEARISSQSGWLLTVWIAVFLFLAFWAVHRTRRLERAVVTEREQLLDSERRHRLLAEHTLDIIWTMNLELEFTYVSPAAYMMLGYHSQELVGRPLKTLCSEQHHLSFASAIKAELMRGSGSSGILLELDLHHKDATTVPVEIRARLVEEQSGHPAHLQGVARDISERRRAEKRRRYQDRLLRDMGRIAHIGAWELDPVSGSCSWTNEVARIHDLEPDTAVDLQLFLSFYENESRKKLDRALEAAVAEGQSWDLGLQLRTTGGHRKWVRHIGQPVIDNDRVIQVRGSLQDITKRVQYRQRIEHLNQVLRTIRDINQVILRENDPHRLIEKTSQILVANRGYDCAVVVLADRGVKIPEKIAAAGVGASTENMRECMAQKQLPLCARTADGDPDDEIVKEIEEVCPACPAAQPGDGRAMQAKLVFGDQLYGMLSVAISHGNVIDDEEKLLFREMAGDLAHALNAIDLQWDKQEAARNQEILQQQLLQAQKMESVGRLAGGIAHDFNNMLSVISGFANLAQEQTREGEQLHEDLGEIIQAADRAAKITRQLLAFARKQIVDPQVLDLNDTVESLMKMLGRLIGENIDLVWSPEEGLWAVKIDPTQIDQILANLLVNARDAIKDVGKITIETENFTFDEEYCQTHVNTTPGDYVMLAVSDDGIGMDDETKKNIFEPFFTTKKVGTGTGLGLAMVYGIVKQNDGFINVYSEPGEGTTIRVYLPRYEGEVAGSVRKMDTIIPSGRGEKILIVEDEEAILRMAARMLRDLGYEVTAAGRPGDALELAGEPGREIDLLITDVVMPEMNGRELAERIQSLHEGIKVLFMSGYTANVIAHHAVLEEGVHFMQKPFSNRTLATMTRKVLDHEA